MRRGQYLWHSAQKWKHRASDILHGLMSRARSLSVNDSFIPFKRSLLKDAIQQRTLIQPESRVCLPAKSFAHLFPFCFFLVAKKIPYFHRDRTLKLREHFQLAPGNNFLQNRTTAYMIWLTASIMTRALSCSCQSMALKMTHTS